MKKVLKITGISVAAAVILTAAIIFIFFPGIFTYFKVKKEYPCIDETIGNFGGFNTEIPDSFITKEINGIRLCGPAEADNDSELLPFRIEDELFITTLVDNASDSESLSEEEHDFSEEEYDHFYESLGVEKPDNTYDSLCFFRNMTAKDCLSLRGTDRKIFMEFAETKQFAADIETLSYYEIGDIKGFFSEYSQQSEKYIYQYALWLFDNDKQYIISVHGNDKDTVMQILSSIEINTAD